MASYSRLAALVILAALSFSVLVFVFFLLPRINDEADTADTVSSAKNSGSAKRLKPVPPIRNSANQNNANNNNSPVEQFFETGLRDHPLTNCPPNKFFSVSDLIQHNWPSDLWIVVHGFVLNVTSFVHHHPGGVNMLMKGAATLSAESQLPVVTDVDDLFTMYHQPGTISLFNTFCIGKYKKN